MATDRDTMIKFVKLMEKHPCLYNPKAVDSNGLLLKRKAWASISREYNAPVLVCKEQWRKIRTAFLKSIRDRVSSEGPRKPYYLYKHLKFLIPFLQPKTVSGEMIAKYLPQEGAEYESDFDMADYSGTNEKDNTDDYRYEDDAHLDEDDEQEIPSQSLYSQQQETPIKVEFCKLGNSFNKSAKAIKKESNDDVERNPRLLFLNSIKAEVMSFSEQEMRSFRRNVIDAIDCIMRAREEQSNI